MVKTRACGHGDGCDYAGCQRAKSRDQPDVYVHPNRCLCSACRCDSGLKDKYQQRSKAQQLLTHGVSTVTAQHFFQKNLHDLVHSDNGQDYGIADCLVVEQGPNYALAKRIQQWRATLARHQGQRVSINIAPSTTTYSVTKNPLLKAAFNGASLFDVEAFAPETTNAIMAALWIHDLRNPQSVANPEVTLNHPLELMMEGPTMAVYGVSHIWPVLPCLCSLIWFCYREAA